MQCSATYGPILYYRRNVRLNGTMEAIFDLTRTIEDIGRVAKANSHGGRRSP